MLSDGTIPRLYQPIKPIMKRAGLHDHLAQLYSWVQTVTSPDVHTWSVCGNQVLVDNSHNTYELPPDLHFEHDVFEDLIGALETGDTFFDVGAFHGHYSIFAAAEASEGSVTAFEPIPRNVEIIRKNKRLNDADQISVEKVGISDAPGEMLVADDGPLTHGSLLNSDGKERVPVKPLSAYVEDSPPDIVKIDVEGAEMRVLEGFTPVPDSCRRIYCEIHYPDPDPDADIGIDLYGDDPSDVYTWFEKHGFETTTIENKGGQGGQEIVCATR